MSLNKFLYTISPAILILIYLFLTLAKINHPGVQYDEILFGNAAVGMVDNSFVVFKIGNFPIMLMSYMGALKAYLFYPIFKIFGVSVYSIRIPMIIIGGISLFFVYEALKLFFDEFIALISLSFIVFDVSFLNYMRYDVGPTVIDFFFKSVILLLLIKFINKQKFTYILFILILFGLGLFNKLNFIWYINAFSIATFFVYRQHISFFFKNYSHRKLLVSSVGLAYFFYLLYFFVLTSVGNLVTLSDNYSEKIVGNYWTFKDLVSGAGFYTHVFGEINFSIQDIYYWTVMSICFFGFFLIIYKKKKPLNLFQTQSYLFFIVSFLLIILQIGLTHRAASGWHLFSIYPFYPVILAVALVSIANMLSFSQVIISTCVVIMISYQIVFYYHYYIAYDKPVKNIFWAKQVYDLIDYTKKQPNKFVSVDWGTHNQLITFTQLEGKFFEIIYKIKGERNYDDNLTDVQKKYIVDDLLRPENGYLFIMHPKRNTQYKKLRNTLFQLARDSRISLEKVRTISDANGETIFEIYAPGR